MASFEASLFRVYERLLSDCVAPRRGILLKCSLLLFAISISALLVLASLHVAYVGRGDCLRAALVSQDGLSPVVIPPDLNQTVAFDRRTELWEDELLLLKTFHDREGFDYAFSHSPLVLQINASWRTRHNIHAWNVTLPESCLGGGPTWHRIVHELGLVDTIVINQLQFGLQSQGFVQNLETLELWSWPEDTTSRRWDLVGWVSFKCQIVVATLFALFMTSTATALLVRVLISSGTVVMFPLLSVARQLGAQQFSVRLMAMSYPWLGTDIIRLLTQRQPITPFVTAHISYVFSFYLMYEASNQIIVHWIYRKSVPDGLHVMVYGLAMVWEYYVFVFVRSKLGVRFFARLVALQFCAFHFYFFSTSYSFYMIAMAAWWSATLCTMLYFLVCVELPALSRGQVSVEQPRGLYVRLPGLADARTQAPLWSMFHVLNAEVRSVYDDAAEQIPPPRRGAGAVAFLRSAAELLLFALPRGSPFRSTSSPAPPTMAPNSRSEDGAPRTNARSSRGDGEERDGAPGLRINIRRMEEGLAAAAGAGGETERVRRPPDYVP